MRYLKTIILLFIASFMLVSCGNNQFKEVRSVTFTSNGKTQTFYPTWYIVPSSIYENATEEEYKTADFKTSVMVPNNTTVDTIAFYTTDLFSGNILGVSSRPYKPYNISKDDIGKYLYIYAHDLGDYFRKFFKIEIRDVGTDYIQVKVKNDTTIVIKKNGRETTYTVTSYSIVE